MQLMEDRMYLVLWFQKVRVNNVGRQTWGLEQDAESSDPEPQTQSRKSELEMMGIFKLSNFLHKVTPPKTRPYSATIW